MFARGVESPLRTEVIRISVLGSASAERGGDQTCTYLRLSSFNPSIKSNKRKSLRNTRYSQSSCSEYASIVSTRLSTEWWRDSV